MKEIYQVDQGREWEYLQQLFVIVINEEKVLPILLLWIKTKQSSVSVLRIYQPNWIEKDDILWLTRTNTINVVPVSHHLIHLRTRWVSIPSEMLVYLLSHFLMRVLGKCPGISPSLAGTTQSGPQTMSCLNRRITNKWMVLGLCDKYTYTYLHRRFVFMRAGAVVEALD